MKQVKPPSLTRVLSGSAGAWWLAHSMHPGFFSVALMLLSMIPILIAELYLIAPKKSPATPDFPPENENTAQEDSA